MAVDLDHCKIGQLVGADHLRIEGAAVVHRDADLGRPINHVIVRHDVPVRRDDHAAADSVLDLRLLRRLLATERSPWPKELPKLRRYLLHLTLVLSLILIIRSISLRRSARGHCHIDDSRRDPRCHCFDCAIQRSERRHAAVVDRSCIAVRGVHSIVMNEKCGSQNQGGRRADRNSDPRRLAN